MTGPSFQLCTKLTCLNQEGCEHQQLHIAGYHHVCDSEATRSHDAKRSIGVSETPKRVIPHHARGSTDYFGSARDSAGVARILRGSTVGERFKD